MEDLKGAKVNCQICGAEIPPNEVSMFAHLIGEHPLQFLASDSAAGLLRHVSVSIERIGEHLGRGLLEYFKKREG